MYRQPYERKSFRAQSRDFKGLQSLNPLSQWVSDLPLLPELWIRVCGYILNVACTLRNCMRGDSGSGTVNNVSASCAIINNCGGRSGQ